jgi:hypothetical protein
MVAYSKPVLLGLAVTILVLPFISCFSGVAGQTLVNPVFTSADQFSAPDFNSTIRFAVNGSCTSIAFSNGTWVFTGLRLGYSRSAANVSISAKNCNMTIFSVSASNFSARSVSVLYNVVGIGSQSIRFVDITKSTTSVEWSVIVPGASGTGRVWLSEGRNWNLQSDNTVFVHNVTGNITVSRYNFGGFTNGGSNQPLSVSHSIALITLGALIAVVAFALVIKLVRKP